jgi:hypothetical protein
VKRVVSTNLGRLQAADLTPEQLETLRQAEAKLNAGRSGQEVYLVALKK